MNVSFERLAAGLSSMLKKSIIVILAAGALFASGLAIRRAVLSAQYECYGRPLPFDLESALYFRYVRMLFTGGELPFLDRSVQYPGGVVVRQTYELGAEYICSALARVFPANIPLDERARWISAGWFCFGIIALVFWLWWWRQSVWGAVLGGAYYACSLASVIRSTGQEISHENFALPLLVSHLAVSALAERENTRFGVFVCASAVAALLLACALMLWDLIQYYIIIWALLGFARVVAGHYFHDQRRCLGWGMTLAALVLAGLLNPYLRAHGFAGSPAMLLAYGAALALFFAGRRGPPAGNDDAYGNFNVGRVALLATRRLFRCRAAACPSTPLRALSLSKGGVPSFPLVDALEGGSDRTASASRGPTLMSEERKGYRPDFRRWGPVLLRLIIVGLPLLAGFFIGRAYLQNYSHFTELLYAKIFFLNAKPSDPALLTFAQRILWVPALNSANFLLTKTLFPVTLPLFFISAIVVLINPRRRTDPDIIALLFFSFMSLTAFILFVRLHVFAIIGFAASIGILGGWAMRRKLVLARVLLAILLLAGAAAEAANVLRNPARWGSGQAYLKERQELAGWLKANAPGQPVLANFGVSAFILTYAGCPIILHPKFESPEIRARVREYGEMLFKADEQEFRSWADRRGAAFYVYALGEFALPHPEAQMRYFVDALNPPPAAPARLFEFKPLAARWFVLLWQNRKYRVFRVITRNDELTALAKVEAARLKIGQGLLTQAAGDVELALLYDPGNKSAQEEMLRIGELREQERAK